MIILIAFNPSLFFSLLLNKSHLSIGAEWNNQKGVKMTFRGKHNLVLRLIVSQFRYTNRNLDKAFQQYYLLQGST